MTEKVEWGLHPPRLLRLVCGATSTSTPTASVTRWWRLVCTCLCMLAVAVLRSAARDWATGRSGHAGMHGRGPGPSRKVQGATSSSAPTASVSGYMQWRSSSVSSSSGCASSWRFADFVGYYIVYITFSRVFVGYIVYIIFSRVCV